jgi:hypothetical protein
MRSQIVDTLCAILGTLSVQSCDVHRDTVPRDKLTTELEKAVDGPSIDSIRGNGWKIGLVSNDSTGTQYSAGSFKSECPAGDSTDAISRGSETILIMIKGCEKPYLVDVPYQDFALSDGSSMDGTRSLFENWNVSNLCLKKIARPPTGLSEIFLVNCSGKLN